MSTLRNFWNDDQGQDLVEFTMLMAFVALASVALFLGAAGSISGIWTVSNSQLAAASTSASLPGRQFAGTVARTALALDPDSRTLPMEVHVPNPEGALLPGMYARVDLVSPRTDAPLLIPSNALIARGKGTEGAVVRQDHRVHDR